MTNSAGAASAINSYDEYGIPGASNSGRVAAGVTTRMLYDGAAMIGEYNSSNVLQRRFVHGPGMDEPLVWYEGAGTSDRRWLLADERGSIVAVTNAAGAVSLQKSLARQAMARR